MPDIYRRSMDGNAAGDSVPFHHGGKYHLFHLSVPGDSLGQQYPYRCTTEQRHAISEDLVTWREAPTALVPGEAYDKDGCWTGSIVEKDGTYYLFYTGHTAGAENPQTICLATGTDGETFEKSPNNPLLRPDPKLYESIDFRDPYIFWNEEEQTYWMLIAARLATGPVGLRGVVALSTSEDLLSWTAPEPFYSPYSTFCPECPEMFKLGEWWYLVYSHFSESMRTTYRISRSPRGPWRTPPRPGLDGRRFYAAKSMPTDDPNRRLMWGSIYERVGLSDDSDWTYAGDFGIARELRSNSDGSLSVSIPAEIVNAFGQASPLDVQPKMGSWDVVGDSAKTDSVATYSYAVAELPEIDGAALLTASVTPGDDGGEFGLLVRASDDLASTHALVFDPQGQRVTFSLIPQSLDPFWESLTSRKVPAPQIDGPHLVERPLAIAKGKTHNVQVILDGSLVEVFVDGEVALSYRIYDEGARNIGFFAQDNSVTFSNIGVAQ
ncbi:GH32 C-terminal domain-containing protein [bacterium RCC_150]